MDVKEVLQAVQYAKARSKKRKFDQSIDLTINFKGIDFKKGDNRIDIDVKLPHTTGKMADVRALLFAKDKEFAKLMKDKVGKVMMDTEVPALKKKEVETLIKEYNVLLAEGPALIVVAKHLGQQLAPRGMMPKLVQNNEGSVKTAMQNVSTFTKITNKKGKFMPVVHITIGKESIKEEHIVENAIEAINKLIESLPNKEGNIKSVYIKTTMGLPTKIGEKYDEEKAEVKKEKKTDVAKVKK